MKTTTKALAACALTLAMAFTSAAAFATPRPVDDEHELIQYAQTYQPEISPLSVTPGPAEADITLPPRGSFSAVEHPRMSYPAASIAVSSGFGPRTCSAGPCSAFHQGVDYPGPTGAPIKSIAAGTVRSVGMDGNYGNRVIIDHVLNGVHFSSTYAHLANGSFAVRAGQPVDRGQLIGRIGNTGRSYGSHLHLEIHVNGASVNPAGWLSSHDALPFP